MSTVLCVVGARPNFMKMAPILEELAARDVSTYLVHTGQHYDTRMCKLFFEDLGMPQPNVDLGVGSGSHAEQTAEVLRRIEKVMLEVKPKLVIVAGDVNSTLSATLAAVKLEIPVAHVEAGLRSFDRAMPEEINRIMTDSVADYHFTTDSWADEQLMKEGIKREQIFFVGNTMIDSLLKHVDSAESSTVLEDLGVTSKNYGVITLHRPSNVDDADTFRGILGALKTISEKLPLVFPIHPRTKARVKDFGLESFIGGSIIESEPLGYLDFLKLNKHARLMFTDSGGVQEETTVLGTPCITLRRNTERPITVEKGTNVLVGGEPDKILSEAERILACESCEKKVPPLWDGKAAARIADIVVKHILAN